MIGRAVASRARTFLTGDWWPCVAIPPLLVLGAAITRGAGALDVLGVLAAFVGCLPLALRRRLPFLLFAPVLTAGIVLVIWQLDPGDIVILIPLIALFDMAQRGDRRRSVWIAVITVPCVAVSIIPFNHHHDIPAGLAYNTLLCLLAIGAGDLLRSRQESAEQAAAVREQAVLRRLGEERLRIAHEIHDVVAHAMTAINVQAGVAAHLLERDPDNAHDALRNIKATSGEALRELRSTLELLRDPGAAAPLTVPSGLTDLDGLAASARAAGLETSVEVDDVTEVPVGVHTAGYRIIQEALTNVIRHARATRARVHVIREPVAVRIEVSDDGAASAGEHAGARQRSARHARAGAGPRRHIRGRGRAGWWLARGGVAARGRRGQPQRRSPRSGHRPGGRRVIRVELADDQALVRAGFRALLDAEPDIEVVAEAEDGETAVALAREHRPEIVLMDIRMPQLDGLEATARITRDAALKDTRVLVLTTFELDDYVFGALRAGASGFLLKDVEPVDLLAGIRVVAGGEALLAPRLTRRLIEAFVARGQDGGAAATGSADGAGFGVDVAAEAKSLVARLTPREREVLTLAGQGLSNREIADRLVLSPLTAKTHVARLFQKLEARDRAQLVVIAYESGVVRPGPSTA